MTDKILEAMQDAERKAWEALSGYKFWMFGWNVWPATKTGTADIRLLWKWVKKNDP